jgi:hypothetical protein
MVASGGVLHADQLLRSVREVWHPKEGQHKKRRFWMEFHKSQGIHDKEQGHALHGLLEQDSITAQTRARS